jgi:DNA-binding transcriptional MerR regulator
MPRSNEIRIGKLSHLTGCNIETIRYYERIGLLSPPPRSLSRYRLYDVADVRRLMFVRRAREVGFSLDEVRALLALSAERDGDTSPRYDGLRLAILPMSAQRSPICAHSNAPLPMPCAAATPAGRPTVR